MKGLRRLIEVSMLWGVWNAVVWGVRKVRLHPLARIEGKHRDHHIGRGTKIGPGSILSVGGSGAIRIGRDCWIYRDAELRTEGHIVIGDRTTLQKGVTLNGNVSIGAGCIIAPNVFVSSGTHIFDNWPEIPIRDQERRLKREGASNQMAARANSYDLPVEIGEDCWLGINVVVSRGVVIGRGCIVGANAVVTKAIEPYSIVAGVPAERIGVRLVWVPPASLDATRPESIPYLYEGFAISVDGDSVSALFGNNVKIALDISNSTVFEMSVKASGKGIISCGRSDVRFSEGENRVHLRVPEEEIRAGAFPPLLSLSVRYESSEGSVRLLSCGLVK